VGSSQADKAASHDRIVTAAAARIRRDGIDRVSVTDLMSEAGLTHGGFYRHFRSRDELVAEAVEQALAEGSAPADAAARAGGPAALARLIDGYLSEAHRDHPESGCAVAALPEDIARSSPRTRHAYGRQVRRYIEVLDDLIPGEDDSGRGGARGEAFLTLAALVGAVSLARAVDDPALSREILEQTARALKART
jgi:TetR/AcrR family transcriptional regulator, transcriptional repressor for nem operon